MNYTKAIYPKDNNITHLNVNAEIRADSLIPSYEGKSIASALGFTYSSIMAPLKYLRFKDPVFSEIMALPKHKAILRYREIRADQDNIRPISNFIYAMQFLIWERVVLDDVFREKLLALKEPGLPLRCYGVSGDVAVFHSYEVFYVKALEKVAQLVQSNCELLFIYNRGPATLFMDIPTFDMDVWNKRYALTAHKLASL